MTEPHEFNDGLPDLDIADGPWPVQSAPDMPMIDFGHLRVPHFPALQARVEIDPRTKAVGAVSIRVGTGAVQLRVITAPRGQAYWSDIRRKLMVNLRGKSSHAAVVEGHFGPEIIATMPRKRRDGSVAEGPVRFIGVEGDRYVLRATVTGKDVTNDAMVERVNALVSRCAVERGNAAAPAGAVLPLSPPDGIPAEESSDDA